MLWVPSRCAGNLEHQTVCERAQPTCPPNDELTQPLMDEMCGHDKVCESEVSCTSANGVSRGPDARGCNDEYTLDVRMALANGMVSDGASRHSSLYLSLPIHPCRQHSESHFRNLPWLLSRPFSLVGAMAHSENVELSAYSISTSQVG